MWSHLGVCQALGTDDKPADAGMVWKAQASDELLRRGCNSSCLACAFEVVRPSDCVMNMHASACRDTEIARCLSRTTIDVRPRKATRRGIIRHTS